MRPVWLCALPHLTGPWSGRRDAHVHTTGLLVLPIDPDEEVKTGLACSQTSGTPRSSSSSQAFADASANVLKGADTPPM